MISLTKNWIEKAHLAVLSLGVLGVMGIASIFFVFTHPLADDFGRAADVQNIGFFASVHKEYFGWTGRWVGVGASQLLNYLFDPVNHYPFFLIGISLFFAVSFLIFFSTILERPNLKTSFLVTGIFLTFYWATMPTPQENFYWLSAALEYHGSIGACLIVLSLLIRKKEAPSILWILLMGAFSILTAGTHEFFGALTCGVILLGTLFSFWKKSPAKWGWLSTLCFFTVGVLIVVLAPGNEIRSANFPDRMNPSVAFQLAKGRAPQELSLWVTIPSLWVLSILIILKQWTAPFHLKWIENHRNLWRYFLPLVWVGMLAAGFFLPSLANGRPVYLRVLNIVYLIFILGWFLSLIVWTDREQPRGFLKPGVGSFLKIGVSLVFVGLLLFTTKNMKLAALDLKDSNLKGFHIQMHERYAYIEAEKAKGNLDVTVSKIDSWPRLYFWDDVSEHPELFRNVFQADYYGLNTIVIETES